MGEIRTFGREKLIIGALLATADRANGLVRDRVEAELEARFGPIDYRSQSLPFAWTDYYEGEMGANLTRFFVSFRNLADPSSLAETKIASNALEERLSLAGRRAANLDPGLLSLGRLILATTKDRCQRIPLRQGIYGEVTLIFEHGAFVPLPWTYPDYRSPEYLGIFTEIRALAKDDLKRESHFSR
jgi:hypothetical protein